MDCSGKVVCHAGVGRGGQQPQGVYRGGIEGGLYSLPPVLGF